MHVTVVAQEKGLFQVLVDGRPVLHPMPESDARQQAAFFQQLMAGKITALASDYDRYPKPTC